MRQQCAAAALSDGRGLYAADTTSEPVNGVLQAGVYCDGTRQAQRQLIQLAGDLAPNNHQGRTKGRTNFHGKPCKSCGRTLHRWTRKTETIPAGHVMHYARQHCVNCRAAYNAELRQWKADNPKQATSKQYAPQQIDRQRHAPETLPGRLRTAQRHGNAAKAQHLIAEAAQAGIEL